MDAPPPTRHLERLEVDRLGLSTTTIREVGDGFVVLDVAAASDTTATRLPDGVALDGERIAASLTVRIDAVGPRTFRYRFALGADVPSGAVSKDDLARPVMCRPSAAPRGPR